MNSKTINANIFNQKRLWDGIHALIIFVGKLAGLKGFQCNASENNFKLNEPIKWGEETAAWEHDTDIHFRHLRNESCFKLSNININKLLNWLYCKYM